MANEEGPTGKEMYRFGPFTVDAQRETLLRAGDPVPLAPKTFQVLLVLIRRNDEVVTKDDLMKEVWPDTFVEEANLSRNIFLLRKALGESPRDHRYVLTVPGRGYRLAEKVQVVPETLAAGAAATLTNVPAEGQKTGRRLWFAGAAVAMLALAAVAVWPLAAPGPLLGEKDTVVLAEFTNTTGDAVFDETLRQGLAVQLAQSPQLSLVSDERIQKMLALMGQPPGARISPDAARGVCERTGSAVVVDGSISGLGTAYVLGLRAKSCRTGEVLADEQAQASRKEDVLAVLSDIAGRLRKHLGESDTSIGHSSMPLADATTPSLDALRAYSLGWKSSFGAAGPAEGIPYFKKAIELDSSFATAYAMLGRVYGDLGESALSSEFTSDAYRLRERTSAPERYFIEMSYEMQVTGDLAKARQAGELWGSAYPRDARPSALLSLVYQGLGRGPEAIEAGEASVRLDPDLVPGYANLAWAYLSADDFRHAKAVVARASGRGLDFPDLYILNYDLGFLERDTAAMERVMTLAEGHPAVENWLLQRKSCVLACDGRLREAQAMTARAAMLAERTAQTDRSALYLAALATREALFGRFEPAKTAARAALRGSRNRDVLYGAAFALAWSGSEDEATPVVTEMETRFPGDTFVNGIYVPTVRAILARNRADYARAEELSGATAQYDLSVPGTWFGFFGTMYPSYLRGLVYLDTHQADKAAAEFQKIVTHRGLVGSDPVGVLAQLQLAGAYAMQGHAVQASHAFRSVAARWERADPEIPAIVHARREARQ